MYKQFKQYVYKLLIPFIRIYKYLNWRFYLLTAKEINIVVGAGPTKYKGWFSTDIVTLDVTKESDFRKYFSKKKIHKVLAEHILEHLTNSELELMAENLFKYSEENVNIRIAVPDGFHSNINYITVSYTHLRAHETVLDLVCRLLLEKKKTTHTIHYT